MTAEAGRLRLPRRTRLRLPRRTLLLAAFALAAVPGDALAAEPPLLSGYGGPGAGEQQLIGSKLIEEPAGAGGSAPSSGGQASEAPASPSASGGQATPRTSKTGHKQSKGAPVGARRGGPPRGGPGAERSAVARPLTSSSQVALASSTLGLSDGELMLVAVVAGALVLLALLTWRLAASRRGGDGVPTSS